MMYTMPKNLLSICVNFALATQPQMRFLIERLCGFTEKRRAPVRLGENRTFDRKNAVLSEIVDKYAGKSRDIRLRGRAEYVKIRCNP